MSSSPSTQKDPAPSSKARAIVRGSYDIHVHVAPDIMPRKIDDLGLARRMRELGLRGVILKSHYTSTAERAAVVRAVVPEVDTLGAITLNSSVGGMNPLAVEIAARSGARLVWMPTVDSENEKRHRERDSGKTPPPFWAKIQDELRAQGMATATVPVVDGRGNVLPETHAVLKVIAGHDMILATGHLGREEILAVVDAALSTGVKRIVITHPEFPTQDLPVADQKELAKKGAFLERCFTTPHTGKISWERMISIINEVGPRHSVLSTDLGQPSNPPVEDGVALFVDKLLEAGFSEDDLHTMAVENSVRLAAKERR